jgi:hypothetical protein
VTSFQELPTPAESSLSPESEESELEDMLNEEFIFNPVVRKLRNESKARAANKLLTPCSTRLVACVDERIMNS